jgi:hypothetical protein
MSGGEAAQALGQEGHCEIPMGGDDHLLRLARLEIGEAQARRLVQTHHLRGQFIDDAPSLGQLWARAAMAHQQGLADLRLQCIDMSADGGLRDAKAHGGRIEAAEIDDLPEDEQTAGAGVNHGMLPAGSANI